MKSIDTIRYGIVGTGMMAIEHIANLALTPGTTVTALADPVQSSLDRAASAVGQPVTRFADADALERFYGQGFKRGSLSKRINVEEIAKSDHLPQLEAATKDTSKGRYHKIDHPPKLLEMVSPAVVRSRASHCERLFVSLLAVIENA